MKIYKQAFTFVELLVSLIILVILATVAFYSYTGYLSDSRDSKRITELDNIKVALESYQIDKSYFPKPDGALDVTYSGSLVWKQGTFGKLASSAVGYSSESIVDPETKNEYTYSIKNTKNEYSLAGILEDRENTLSFNNHTYAESNQSPTALVVGNYNGVMTHVKVSGIDFILAVPSIIASDLSSTNLLDIDSNNRYVYDGYKNLPSSYFGSKYELNNDVDLRPNELILFYGSLSDFFSGKERVLFLQSVKDSYENSNADKKVEYIYSVLNSEINTLVPSRDISNLACDTINFKLNYKVDCNYTNFRAFYVLKDATVLSTINFDILQNEKINYIFEDNTGNLWFATDTGVYMYDGAIWNHLTASENGLINNKIDVVSEDGNSDIWFGATNGLSRYDPDTGVVTNYKANAKNPNLPHSTIYDIILDSNTNELLIGTHQGVGIYDSTSQTIDSYIVPPIPGGAKGNKNEWININHIFLDKNSIRWYGTNRGIVRHEGATNFSRYDGTDGLPYQGKSKEKTYVNTIGEDIINNELWIGTDDGIGKMTSVYPGTISKYNDGNSNLADNTIHAVYQDPDTGKMWFGTDSGVSIYDRIEDSFENFYVDKDNKTLGTVYFIYSSSGSTILGTGGGTTTLE